MDWLLLALAVVALFAGLLGCILPIIPGPPLSFVGMLLLHWTSRWSFDSRTLAIMAVVAIAVTVLDYVVPLWGTKRFGGSKRGVWGSTIGLIIGLFLFPPFGIIVGPFIGAFVGELSVGKNNSEALKSGIGSLIGFLLGTASKFIASGVMTWYFIKEVF